CARGDYYGSGWNYW
nr:immunoglobulin heavy chain junction region [Macaca mulatta]MOV41274.1 immunoglobulin heavy chain junction region [Macaca mulatta]MOV42863.1 immunoglobulin heavy chain junction region [Macaca mulatta]MOV43364.1 immunoglobulin heavy chain junction region [Macaca mulatta]MOV46778.1 immunoglobulin heavy chain junction region [Macaca mulatta]